MSDATICLSRLFSLDALLADRDGDGLPDAVRARLVVDEQARLPEHLAAVEIAARLGFETLALALPLVVAAATDLPDDAVAVFIGRPATLAPGCPASLRAALDALRPGEGIVAGDDSAVMVAGADAAGLAEAARIVAAELPAAQPDSAAALPLMEIRKHIANLCGAAPVVESLLTRAGRAAEVRLRVRVPAADRIALRQTLMAGIDAQQFPHDLTIVLVIDDQRDPRVVRIVGRQRTMEPGLAPVLPTMDVPPLRSLAGLYGPSGLAGDADGDLLPELPRTHIVLPDDLSAREAAEAAHLAARLGLESLGLRVPLAFARGVEPQAPGQVTIAIEPLDAQGRGADEGSVHLEEARDGTAIIKVSGSSARGRAMALRGLAELDASTAPGEREPSLHEMQQALGRLLALADPEAWACAAIVAARRLPGASVALSPEPLVLSVELPDAAAARSAAAEDQIVRLVTARTPGLSVEADICGVENAAPIVDESHRLTWEVDELWQHVTTEVMPALQQADQDWLLDLRVSEPEGRRRQIKNEALRQIRAAGLAARPDQVRVLPAYHQGRAWLLEEIAPRLQGRDIATITIRVQRFARDYPCLELSIRWLQELHLVDELLGERLDLPHHAIRFELSDSAHTYEVEARDGPGEIVLQADLDVIYGQRPYLAGFPEWGMVHPSSGCVRLLVAGQPLIDRRVAPDPERVWDLVQTTLLPRLRAHILAATGGTPRIEDQPFFGELAAEVWLSEEDSALGLREERISPLESLHEDLYFMLLDYCCAVTVAATSSGEPYLPPWVRPRDPGGSAREPRQWMAPGRIVPYIHRGDGSAGRVRLTLTAAARHTPQLVWSRGGATGTIALVGAPECTLGIVGLRWSAGNGDADRPHRQALLQLDGPDAACEQAMAMLSSWAALRAVNALPTGAIPDSWAFSVRHATNELHIDAAPMEIAGGAAGSISSLMPDEPAVPWDRVLGLAEVERAVHGLARLPGVRAYQAGRSARGHPSYAIEVTLPRTEGIWSRAKLSAWKCTLLLNARHHANETSSTSAVLRLVSLLAGDEEWRHLLKRVNVVIIPCENPDGAALHYALQQEHPTWMHHAGRYNDAGLEFVSEYANPLTRHTEALVLPALWHAWAPDIVCDDHGFPSHEWIQPFAGHSNPWFQSHWISQGLIYLILPRITNPHYAGHARASDEVRRRMVRILADDRAVRARNSSYADRYRTFLSDWLPEAFPAPFDEDILVHTYDFDPDDRARGSASLAGLAGAYPGVTTLSLVTEVADETAQGSYMALCAHTHLLANRALLEYLYDVDAPASLRRERHILPHGAVLLRAVRPRPIRAG